MATLPANRTKLQVAITNQQPSIIASSQANRDALIESYDTLDLLYQYVGTLIANGTLQPYPFGVNRQALFNGGFAVNQRGVSGTVTLAAGAYGHDRWKAGAAGCTYTFATVNNVTTITITAGSLTQFIEGIHLYSGTYTLSWSGTAQGKIGAGAYGSSGVTGVVTGGTNISVEFGIGTVNNAQFNFGSTTVSFQPRSFAEELALCQRYYQRFDNEGSGNSLTLGSAASATGANMFIQLITKMRVIPSLVYSALADLSLNDGATAGVVLTGLSVNLNQSSSKLISLTALVASGLTQFRPYFLAFSSGSTKFIAFDAEL